MWLRCRDFLRRDGDNGGQEIVAWELVDDNRMRRILPRTAWLAFALAASLFSAPASKPKLVVAVAIDQFRYDYLTRFRDSYHAGLARVLDNGAVFTDPDAAGVPVGKGAYHWDGAAGTWFWVDPVNDLLYVGLVQLLSETAPPLQKTTQTMMADAIVGD